MTKVVAGIALEDEDRVIEMDADEWLDAMANYKRGEYKNEIMLSGSGAVYVAPSGGIPGYIWVYQDYIPVYSDGKYLGYGTIDGKNKIVHIAHDGTHMPPSTDRMKNGTRINVTGGLKTWKVKR